MQFKRWKLKIIKYQWWFFSFCSWTSSSESFCRTSHTSLPSAHLLFISSLISFLIPPERFASSPPLLLASTKSLPQSPVFHLDGVGTHPAFSLSNAQSSGFIPHHIGWWKRWLDPPYLLWQFFLLYEYNPLGSLANHSLWPNPLMEYPDLLKPHQ